MSIVSNASPLIDLAQIGQLELLHELYDEIYVPEAVWQEVVVAGAGLSGAELVANASWIKRHSIKTRRSCELCNRTSMLENPKPLP